MNSDCNQIVDRIPFSEFIATQDGAAFWRFVEATKDVYSSVNLEKGTVPSLLPRLST